MSQNKNSVLKNVLHYSIFLLVLGLLVGGILAALNAWTYPIIKERKEREVREKLEASFTFTSFETEGLLEKYPLAGANASIENIYLIGQEEGQYNEVVYEVKSKGYGGDVVYFLSIYGTGVIGKLVVFDVSSETPGFGSKAATHDFNVAGRSTEDFVFEVGSKENYIAGSTVTSRAVDAGVTLAVEHYNKYKDELGLAAVETKTFKFESCEQDLTALPDLRYKYVLSYGDDVLNVLVDGDYKVVSVTEAGYDDKHQDIETLIATKQLKTYIASSVKAGNVYTVEAYGTGFEGKVKSTYTIESGKGITAVDINDKAESYPVSNDVAAELAAEILEKQETLDDIAVVSGATVTSNAILDVAKLVARYMVDVLGIQPVKPVEKVFKVESRAQNMAALPELEFKYEVSYGDEILNITVDSNYKLLTISNEDYLAKKEEIETVIGKRKVSEYIKSASVEGDVTTLEIYTNGFAGRITSIYTIEGGSITAVTINDSGESYDQVGVSTDLATHFPSEIIAGQADIDSISVVSGASVTSNAILRAAKLAKQYISEVLS
ncbi:MAG TPA: FMN-binding protein [Acholeplasmataceae bacterium]|nr:FMN-binding protein [Acholeplasmataceae bacterium]